jgi:hypothetical protein
MIERIYKHVPQNDAPQVLAGDEIAYRKMGKLTVPEGGKSWRSLPPPFSWIPSLFS